MKGRMARRVLVSLLAIGLFAAVLAVIHTTTPGDLVDEPASVAEETPEAEVVSLPPVIDTDDSQHESLASLYEKNADTIGWMTIEGTKTDNVVMLDRAQNNYYLNRKFDGRSATSGELYIDGRCRVEPGYLSQNLTVYGHHMINGTMFGQIKKYRNISFYKEHPTFRFDTLWDQMTWKVFALFVVDLTDKRDRDFDYRQPDYATGEEFLAFVDEIRRRSEIDVPVDINENDRIICLSTCTYVSDDARLVVCARLVRPGEDPGVDVSQARNK